MYLPSQFEENRIEVLRALVAEHPLAALVTADAEGIEANHIPLLYDCDPAPLGTLRGHVARANPLWRKAAHTPVLVIFCGPSVYVTPSWYPSKKATGKVVPTWNYAVVHAHGALRAIDDAAWLHAFLTRLTDRQEGRRAQPWRVTDAPPDYVAGSLRAIVGIEIRVTRIVGKWKVSQNRLPADRDGVVEGLRAHADPAAHAVADMIVAATEKSGDRGR